MNIKPGNLQNLLSVNFLSKNKINVRRLPCAGYRHVQLRSSNNQPLDISSLFICCKLEDDSSPVHTADVGVGAAAAALGECRGGSVDGTWSGKKAAARGTAALRPRDDGFAATVDKEVRRDK